MIYGCIGETLKHSFSKEIHNALTDYSYELCEVAKDELNDFATKRDFKAINVTIPYKELIIPHLYYMDDHAKAIGAVNTVVNRDGKLYGYNTDFYGMTELIKHIGIEIEGKKVIILGTGGTSKTARAVVNALGARQTVTVSRTKKTKTIDYTDLYSHHTDADIIINTTPVGMYPNGTGLSCDIAEFKKLSGVIDAIYNPLRTRLVSDALERGIPAEGGLYMLVAQAVRASEIFLDTVYPNGEIERIYKKMLSDKENIVLIGMPASGKSTVGKILSSRCNRELLDTDDLISKKEGVDIPTIFAQKGEDYFRRSEADTVKTVSEYSGKIIATGGGAVLNMENIRALRSNGKIYFIDRAVASLIPTPDRPLSQDREAIEKRYRERYPLYTSRCDVSIDANRSPEQVADIILGDFKK